MLKKHIKTKIICLILPLLCTLASPNISTAQVDLASKIEAQNLFQEAKSLRISGQLNIAEEMLISAIAINPQLAEAHSLLAEMLAARQSFLNAQQHMSLALQLSPTDPDIKMAQARIFYWQGKNNQALLIMERVLGSFPEYEDAQLFYARLLSVTGSDNISSWRGHVATTRSSFSRIPLSPWTQTTIDITRDFSDKNSAVFTLDLAERFSLKDVSLSTRFDHKFSKNGGSYASLSHTFSDEFLPEWTVATGGYYTVSQASGVLGPTIVGVDSKYRSYALAKVVSVDVWLSQYVLNGKGWLTLRSINSFVDDGQNPKGYLIRGDYFIHDNVRIYAGYAKAPESDRGIVTTTVSYFTGLVVKVNDRVDFHVDYSEHDRESSYIRKEVGAGLSYKF